MSTDIHKGHTMIKQLAAYFNSLFNMQGQTTYGSELEQYIVSKHPQSAAEIDQLTRQFDRTRTQGSWL